MAPAHREGIEWDAATGEVRFHIGDASYYLPPPTFGQFRKVMELDHQRVEHERAAIRDAQVQALDADAKQRAVETHKARLSELEFGTPEYEECKGKLTELLDFVLETPPDIATQTRARCIELWCDVARTLGVDFPTPDELPTWASNFAAIGKTIDHWVSFPFQDLGEPDPPPATVEPPE
jgi:hypothetical protein